MNSDEIDALLTKLVISGFSAIGADGFATASQEQAIAGGLGALIAVLYGVYRHWNMKKVPEGETK